MEYSSDFNHEVHKRALDAVNNFFEEKISALKDVIAENPKLIPALKMAIGLAMIGYGIKNGAVDMAHELYVHAFGQDDLIKEWASLSTGSAFALLAKLIGSIGVAAQGSAIGIPVSLLVSAAFLIGSALGYSITDIVQEYMHHHFSMSDYAMTGSLIGVGFYLVISGAKEFFSSKSSFLPVLYDESIANSSNEYCKLEKNLSQKLRLPASIGAGTAAGYVAYSLAMKQAIASTTFLGSSHLGSIALATGAISAPISTPIAIGGAAALATSSAVWHGINYLNSHKKDA